MLYGCAPQNQVRNQGRSRHNRHGVMKPSTVLIMMIINTLIVVARHCLVLSFVVTPLLAPITIHRKYIADIHEEVLKKFYGCG